MRWPETSQPWQYGQCRTSIPQRAASPGAYKMIVPAGGPGGEQKSHEGYEWMYVLSGQLRLWLGEHDFVMKPGEAAEFDTRTPHWFGSAGAGLAEVLVLFGPQGERAHVRARPRRARRTATPRPGLRAPGPGKTPAHSYTG
jgi:quercetin dioxygenase-like cupin family protein